MEVVNDTPYAFLPFDCTPTPTLPALSLIVKGTFKLKPGERAEALGKDAQPPLAGDDVHMDDLGRSLRYSNDLVAMKLRGEILVTATCHPIDGRARTAVDVTIAIGPIKKTLRVSGDRTWAQSSGGLPIVTRTQPFESMPIRYELAFGGLAHPQNPLGRGIDAVPDPAGAATHWLPNVEYFEKRVNDPKDRPPPAGFGPISPMWEPRLGRQGTRDQRWAMFRAPLPPQDFDPRFYNAAPDDQQLPEGFFRGDETLTLTGLHKELPVYEAMLPGKRLRVFVLVRAGAAPDAGRAAPGAAPNRFVEVNLKLDTVHVDADAETMALVWRQPIKTKSRAHPEIEAVYLAEEELAAEPLAREVYFARLEAIRGPRKMPTADAVQLEADAQMAEAKKILKDGNVDPALVKEIDGMKDPKQIFDRLMRFSQDKVKEIEALTEQFKRTPGA